MPTTKTIEELLIEYLFEGLTQKEIALELKKKGYKSCSLSSLEKLLKKIRKDHDAKTMFHLGVILSRKVNHERQKDNQ